MSPADNERERGPAIDQRPDGPLDMARAIEGVHAALLVFGANAREVERLEAAVVVLKEKIEDLKADYDALARDAR